MKRRALTTVAVVALVGCADQPMAASDEAAPLDGLVVALEMKGFSWVVDESLAGMPQPGPGDDLQHDLLFLEQEEIELLVSLTEDVTDVEAALAHGIAVLHIPLKDFTAPTQEQLLQFTSAAHLWQEQGRRVGVHCRAGLGRTGTFLSAYFVSTGMSPRAAIAHVRALRPGSVETDAQEQAVFDFQSTLIAQASDKD